MADKHATLKTAASERPDGFYPVTFPNGDWEIAEYDGGVWMLAGQAAAERESSFTSIGPQVTREDTYGRAEHTAALKALEMVGNGENPQLISGRVGELIRGLIGFVTRELGRAAADETARLVEFAVHLESERCAKIADAIAKAWDSLEATHGPLSESQQGSRRAARDIADRIRKRK